MRPGATDDREKPPLVARLADVLRMAQSPLIEAASAREKIRGVQVAQADTGQLYQDPPDSEVRWEQVPLPNNPQILPRAARQRPHRPPGSVVDKPDCSR